MTLRLHRLRPARDAIAAVAALLSLSACGDDTSTSLAGPDVLLRAPGVLQLEVSSPLPTALADRTRSSAISWSPAFQGMEDRFLVPSPVIEVRDTVRVGQAVDIVVNTIGENGCWTADGGSLAQRGDSALISVYDRHSGASVCTEIWSDRLPHRFTTTFPRVGVGVIRATGRRARAGSTYAGLALTVAGTSAVVAERRVVVIP